MDKEDGIDRRAPNSPNTVPRRSRFTSPIRSILGHRDPQPYIDDEAQNIAAMNSSKKPSKMQRLKEWRKSRSRRFWILLGSGLTAVVLLVIFLPYFLTRPEPASLPVRPGVIPHSYMVDIKSANDEETRLTVIAMHITLFTCSTGTKSLRSWMPKMSLTKSLE